jgi:hypothetical protein
MNNFLNRGLLSKTFVVTNLSLGLYGFSRGYRSSSKYDHNEKLTSRKILDGTITSIFYMIPPWNLYYVTKLLNRMEIKYKNLDKSLYNSEYEDLTGQCTDTI